MPAQDRESKKNYIGVLSDWGEEQRTVDSLVKSDRRMKDYFLGLMAAVLNRRSDARQRSPGATRPACTDCAQRERQV